MRAYVYSALLAVFALWGTPTLGHAATDCPLANTPYSRASPLLDLLLNPDARRVLEQDSPGLLRNDHEGGVAWSTVPPTFAAILTPSIMLGDAPGGRAQLSTLDSDLARVRLTPAAVQQRCARYDETPPAIPPSLKRPALLVFDKITGFRDGPSVDAAAAAVREIAAAHGWGVFFTDNGAVFNARDLSRFNAVVWNNNSGDVLTVPQRAAFQTYMQGGGGFAGIHGAGGDPVYFWTWYVDELIGARFIGHPMQPQFQEARVIVADPHVSITHGLPNEWRMTDEWYSFQSSPRGYDTHVLLKLDESTYSLVGMFGRDLTMGEHPIAWSRCIGKGRSFYTAIGHLPDVYAEARNRRFLDQGIAWAMGQGDSFCQEGHTS